MKHMLVPKLRESCLIQSARLLLGACKKLEKLFGGYQHHAIINAVQNLQDYLLEHLGSVINDVCKIAHQLLSGIRDVRILFAVEMQKYTKIFNFQNEIMFADISTDARFWTVALGTLTNAVVIDIRELYCNNEMVGSVCDNCLLLEEFRFTSRFKQRGILMDHDPVTPAGLKRLLEMKKIRIVEDTCYFEDFPKPFLIHFYEKLLPRLENFEHGDFEGLILDNLGTLDSLPLTHLRLSKQSRTNMLAILRLCPKLQHLHLTGDLYGSIFDDLVDYTANLKSFRVDNFLADFMAGLSHFLFNKGDHLTRLAISTEAVLSVNEISLIGECCPQLECLELDLNITRNSNPYLVREVQTHMPIFGCLNSLTLGSGAQSFIDVRIVKLLLKHSCQIKYLSLEGKWIQLFEEVRTLSNAQSTMFPNLLSLKVRVILEHAKFYAVPLVKSLYINCSKLRFFHLYSNSLKCNNINAFFALTPNDHIYTANRSEPADTKIVRYMNTKVF